MRFDVVTLFPEMVSTLAEFGVTGRAIKNGVMALETWNPREYTGDTHRTVDDRPYGGGPGMVMKVEPLRDAIKAARAAAGDKAPVICLSPQGETFTQTAAMELARHPGVILVAGRYEGIDERLLESEIDREISLGDFVMSGGEIAALAVIDTIARLVPGVLGDEESAQAESFMQGLLDFPHYTRPENFNGQQVPEVLLSGDHEAIRRWRLKQALGRTWLRRPDLIARADLDPDQQALLDEFIAEQENTGR